MRSEIHSAIASFRNALISLAVFSGFSNLLMLTGAIFMLEVYDRVIPSRSLPTLVSLAILAATLFSFQAGIDIIRSRIFSRLAGSLADKLSRRIFLVSIRAPLVSASEGAGRRPIRDLDQLRGFLASGGPIAFFDLPWIPLYIGICFAFHFWIGFTASVGAAVLLALTLLAELKTRRPTEEAARAGSNRMLIAEASRRNAEVLHAMGMANRFAERFEVANARYLAAQQQASDVSSGFVAVSKIARTALQSAVLAVGAYLVIDQQATGGVIIAGSILSARALAPVDLAIGNWKGFEAARRGWKSLVALLAALPEKEVQLRLPAPRIDLSVENLTVRPPGESRLVLDNINFQIRAGSALGIIGPSAAGKSSLARALVGIWPAVRGKVRLDGAAVEQWSAELLGHHIGYLPQDIELFEGTIAQNIARFDPDASADAVVAAARAARVHDMIVRLAEGYQTRIGEGGVLLSAGQRQRVALARALYGDPFLVVLDEPNSNLDSEGENALAEAIGAVRARNGVLVVIAHRPSVLASLDQVLMLSEGRVQAFGPRDEVLTKVLRPGSAGKLASGV